MLNLAQSARQKTLLLPKRRPPVEKAPFSLLNKKTTDEAKINALIEHFAPKDARQSEGAVGSISTYLKVCMWERYLLLLA